MPQNPGAARGTRGRPPLSEEQVSQMRTKVAAAAQRLFREEGYESVSMRRLAAEVGCTPMSLYTYYDSKIAILRDLWADVFADLFAHVRRAKPAGRSAEALLFAKCRAYVRYWVSRPEEYRLVFMSAGVTQSDVSVFVDSSASAAHYAVFFAALAATTDRPEAEIAAHAQALICGLNGICHNLITISGYPWLPAETLVRILVEGVVTSARAG
jgi:AcrR family transcriptional regulator